MFGGVMPLPAAIAVAAGRQARSVRSFRANVGTIDYVNLSQPVVLPADFRISWTGQVPAGGGHIFCRNLPADNRVFFGTNGSFSIFLGGSVVFDAIIAQVAAMRGDGKLHSFAISRVGAAISLSVDGMSYPAGTSAGTFIIDRLMSKWSAATGVPNYAGVMANVQIESAGQLIHHWPMDESEGDIHYDIVGGNHGTIINPQPSDRERFESLPGSKEWLGRDIFPEKTVAQYGSLADVAATRVGANISMNIKTTSGTFVGAEVLGIENGYTYQARFDANQKAVDQRLWFQDQTIKTSGNVLNATGGTITPGRLNFRDTNGHVAGDIYEIYGLTIRRLLEIA